MRQRIRRVENKVWNHKLELFRANSRPLLVNFSFTGSTYWLILPPQNHKEQCAVAETVWSQDSYSGHCCPSNTTTKWMLNYNLKNNCEYPHGSFESDWYWALHQISESIFSDFTLTVLCTAGVCWFLFPVSLLSYGSIITFQGIQEEWRFWGLGVVRGGCFLKIRNCIISFHFYLVNLSAHPSNAHRWHFI